MKSVYKGLLPLFIGMALISCVEADSSAQKKGAKKTNLFKAGTPSADSIISRMPEFALSIFKESTDSVPGEYYYHATNGRVDTLFKKEVGQNKPIVSIVYDSLNWQSNYEIKKDNYSYFVKDDVLTGELDFPKSYKLYWNNGKLKGIATGILYKDDQNVIQVDSGHMEFYSESGSTLEQSDWKDKQPTAYKQWNENGTLIKDMDFPKYFKEYWDNGKPEAIKTGILYRDDQGIIHLDSGHEEVFFENGKINQQNDWKNKLAVVSKVWNENGVLIKDIEFPKYGKEYWDNGKLKGEIKGILYRADQGDLRVESGHSELYFENGKKQQQGNLKDKQLIELKEWNENGVLIKELNFPRYLRAYWNTGKPKDVMIGKLYRDDQDVVRLDSGRAEIYFENGKLAVQKTYKGKKIVSKTERNENGVIIISAELPKRYREFYDDGKIKAEVNGTVVEEDESFKIKDGTYNVYDQNGNVTYSATYKDFQGTPR